MFCILRKQKVTPFCCGTDANLAQSFWNCSGSVFKLKAHSSVLHNGASLVPCVENLLQKGITILTENVVFQFNWQGLQTKSWKILSLSNPILLLFASEINAEAPSLTCTTHSPVTAHTNKQYWGYLFIFNVWFFLVVIFFPCLFDWMGKVEHMNWIIFRWEVGMSFDIHVSASQPWERRWLSSSSAVGLTDSSSLTLSTHTALATSMPSIPLFDTHCGHDGVHRGTWGPTLQPALYARHFPLKLLSLSLSVMVTIWL